MKKFITKIEGFTAMSLVMMSIIALRFVVYAPQVTNEVITSLR